MESDVITLQDIFEFQVDSIVDETESTGPSCRRASGPTQLTKFERRSIPISTDLFVRDEAFDVFKKRERR